MIFAVCVLTVDEVCCSRSRSERFLFLNELVHLLSSAVFDTDPDLIREGGTIPIARTFQDVTGKSIIMMPIGGFDDGLHSQNEKMSRFESGQEVLCLGGAVVDLVGSFLFAQHLCVFPLTFM